MTNDQDQIYMNQALELAKIRRGFCAPNPSVGAVIVKDHEVIATGYHFASGQPHAEVDALQKISHAAQGATIYVTLEPCCHFGKTPPCTQALINAGIKRVVFGYQDPNPVVASKGEKALQEANIICDYLPLPEIQLFYESYKHWHQTKKPFVTAKIAMSLDGKIAAKLNERTQITGDGMNAFTHFCRKNSDAILTTARTIIIDNPLLNVRIDEEMIPKNLYILDSQLTLPFTAKIFKTAKSITIFHSNDVLVEKVETFKAHNVRCVPVIKNSSGLDLHAIINFIGEEGIHDLWVEAGSQCFNSFLKHKLLNKAYIYIAPRVLGEGVAAFTEPFDFYTYPINWQQIGQDVLCEIRC